MALLDVASNSVISFIVKGLYSLIIGNGIIFEVCYFELKCFLSKIFKSISIAFDSQS